MITGETFGERVSFYRRRLGSDVTQEHLASMVGVSRGAVNAWEKGKQEPKVTHLLKLMEALGVSCAELLQGLPSEPSRGDVTVSKDWDPESVSDSRGLIILERIEAQFPSDPDSPSPFLTALYAQAFQDGLRADEFGPLDNRRDDLLPPPNR